MPDEQSPASRAAIPLGYEPPQPKPEKDRSLLALAVITLFICGASVGLFAIEAESRSHFYNAPAARPDSWPAAVAVLALAGMGTSFGYFLTRRR